MARPDSKWYKLDSAGILYSALQKEEYSAIYRFSARMEREVDPAALQRAIDRCMPRFPSFTITASASPSRSFMRFPTAAGPSSFSARSLPNTCARPAWTFPRETACSI